MPRMPVRGEKLRQRLDALVATFDLSTIEPDPLQLVLRYDDPRDQEIAGLLAGAFAYGRADIVVRNGARVLDRMLPSPYEYLVNFDRAEGRRRFAGVVHRVHKTPALSSLPACISAAIRDHGSLAALFRGCYPAAADDIAPSLTRF